MLRKKDLVKEFELLTKQEIVNHQNSINATNLLLNKFQKRLDEILLLLQKEVAVTNGRFVTHAENFQRHKTQTLGEIKENKGLLRSIKWRADTFVTENQERMSEIESNVERNKLVSALHKDLIFFREEYQRDLMEIKQSLLNGLKSLDKKWKSELKRTSLDMSLKPSHLENMERDILKKVVECHIDNKGLIKEVLACKKTCFIIQKKIENLYTIHERLSDKIEETKVAKK